MFTFCGPWNPDEADGHRKPGQSRSFPRTTENPENATCTPPSSVSNKKIFYTHAQRRDEKDRKNVELERSRELATEEGCRWGLSDYHSFGKTNQHMTGFALGQKQFRTVQDPVPTAAETE